MRIERKLHGKVKCRAEIIRAKERWWKYFESLAYGQVMQGLAHGCKGRAKTIKKRAHEKCAFLMGGGFADFSCLRAEMR